MVGAEDAQLVFEECFVGCGGSCGVAGLASPVGELATGREGVGVVGAQHP